MAAIRNHLFKNDVLTIRAQSIFGSSVKAAYLSVLKEDDGDNDFAKEANIFLTSEIEENQLRGVFDNETPIALEFNDGHIVTVSADNGLFMFERIDDADPLIFESTH